MKTDVSCRTAQAVSVRRQRRGMAADCAVSDADEGECPAARALDAGAVQRPALRHPVWEPVTVSAARTGPTCAMATVIATGTRVPGRWNCAYQSCARAVTSL